MSRERIVELAQRVAALRGQLAACEEQLDGLITGGPAKSRVASAPGKAPAATDRGPGGRKRLGLRPGGLPARMVELLGRDRGRAMTAPAIAESLKASGRVVSATLVRLSQEGRLRRVARGEYRSV
jgi:hypothetical protein